MWKVSKLYEKVHNIANLEGYTTVLFMDTRNKPYFK